MVTFAKATKAQAKARIAIYGPSGSGKTYTSLRIATGLGGPIGVIDTERGSASKYADRFDFLTVDLEDRTIAGYCEALKAAAEARLSVVIIDSMSHAWEELLADVEKIAKAKYKGNTWSAWNEGTPKQRQLVNAILDFPGHIIASMRSRTEWAEEKDERTGRMKPVRIGLSPMQGKGIEYEFDILMEINTEHMATIAKDRSGKFQDQHIEKPDEAFGQQLAAWLSDGIVRQAPSMAEQSKALRTEHTQAAKTAAQGTGHAAFDKAMASLPELVKQVGSREALDKWLVIVREITGHPASMPLSAAAVEKRDSIARAISCLSDIMKNGCPDPAFNGDEGANALRADYDTETKKAHASAAETV